MGIPQIGCNCATCRSDDPRDRRTRTGAVIESDGQTILIDTPPELRLQLLANGISKVDAVLYTHLHADHVHGIDDLRSLSLGRVEPLPIHGPAQALDHIRKSFDYIFDDTVVPVPGTSKPRLTSHPLEANVPVAIAGMPVLPLEFEHGHARVFGYRIGPLAYVTDVKRVSEANAARLEGLELLVLSALWWRPHPTHLSVDEAIVTARRIGAGKTLLTHLSHETSHQDLLDQLPEGIEPGYDTQQVLL